MRSQNVCMCAYFLRTQNVNVENEKTCIFQRLFEPHVEVQLSHSEQLVCMWKSIKSHSLLRWNFVCRVYDIYLLKVRTEENTISAHKQAHSLIHSFAHSPTQ